MTTLNLLKTREKENYLLEVETTPIAKSVTKPRVRGGFAQWKKATSATIAAVIMGIALLSGLVINTGNTSNTAFAGEDPNPFNWPSLFCLMKDDSMAYLGGSNDVVKSGWQKNDTGNPNEGLLAISVPRNADGSAVSRFTALEQYGYFSPNYTTWQGAYIEPDDNKGWPFVGTGGGGSTTSYGPAVTVQDADKSPMFSHDWSECGGVMDSLNVSIANGISYLPKMFVAVSGEIYGWATTVNLTNPDSPLSGVAKGIETLIIGDGVRPGLKDVLFLEFLTPIVLLGAISLTWTGIVKRSSMQAAQGAGWMIGATIAGMIFLTNPLLVPTTIDNTVASLNGAINGSLVTDDAAIDMCNIGETGTGIDAQNRDAIRQVKCVIWYSTVYVPWVTGQFGVDAYTMNNNPLMTNDANTVNADGDEVSTSGASTPAGDKFKEAIDGGSNAPSADNRGVFEKANIKFGSANYTGKMNWALYQLDRQHNPDSNRGLDYSEIAYNQLVINDNTQWKGAGQAMGSAWLSLIGAVGPSLVLIIFSFMLIGYQLTMLILIALAPILLLAGVAPGWGRRIAMRWLELIVGIFAKRLLLLVFLMFYIKIYTLIMGITAIGWLGQAIMVTALSIVILTQREKIMKMFTDSIDFGGNKAMGDGGQIGNAIKQKAQRGTGFASRVAQEAAIRGVPVVAKKTMTAVRSGGGNVATASQQGAGRIRNAAMAVTKGDKRLGLGAEQQPNVLKAHDYATPENFNVRALPVEQQKRLIADDGTVDLAKTARFIESQKKRQLYASNEINTKFDELKRDKEIIKKMENSGATKTQRLEAKRDYLKKREELRAQQAKLNADVYRLFGKPEGDGNGNPAFDKKTDYLNPKKAVSKTAKKVLPTKLNTKYTPINPKK